VRARRQRRRHQREKAGPVGEAPRVGLAIADELYGAVGNAAPGNDRLARRLDADDVEGGLQRIGRHLTRLCRRHGFARRR
jgi:hypothetical protein